MAKLKLPFELEKPSSNEYVTQTSQIGHNGQPLSTKIEAMPDVKPDPSDADLNFADENGNVVIQSKGGHIKTKNFDSSQMQHTVTTEEGQTRLVVGSAFVESGVLYL